MYMSSGDHLLLIILSMLVALGPRLLPMKFFTTRKIPEWFNEWMKYVPVSLFTALVVKDLFLNSDIYTFVGLQHVAKLLAAALVVIVAYKSRSMGLSVVCGLAAVALLSTVVG